MNDAVCTCINAGGLRQEQRASAMWGGLPVNCVELIWMWRGRLLRDARQKRMGVDRNMYVEGLVLLDCDWAESSVGSFRRVVQGEYWLVRPLR